MGVVLTLGLLFIGGWAIVAAWPIFLIMMGLFLIMAVIGIIGVLIE